jgi:Bacterial PH domain
MFVVVDANRVQELARAKIPSRYFFTVWLRKALNDLPNLIKDDEELLTLAKGASGNRVGVLAVTDNRAIIVTGAPVRRRVESLPLNQVASVESRRSFKSGRVHFAVAGKEVAVRAIVPRARADEISDVVRSKLIQPTE